MFDFVMHYTFIDRFLWSEVILFITIWLIQCSQVFIVQVVVWQQDLFLFMMGSQKNIVSHKLQHWLNPNCTWKIIWYIPLQNFPFGVWIKNSIPLWLPSKCQFNIEPYKKNILKFFSEITEPFDRILCWNAALIFLCNMYVCFVSVRNARWPPPQVTI